MDPQIQEILRTTKTTGLYHSHVSMGKVRGKYVFNRDDLERFWNCHMNTMQDSKEVYIGVAEKPQQYLPVLADIDIKIRDDIIDDIGIDIKTGIHKNKHVIEVIGAYQSVLRNILSECTENHLICVLLEKPVYIVRKNGISYMKHGFHLHFPNCFLNRTSQEVHLIPRVQNMLREFKTFEDIGFEDSGKMVDDSCCKVPWLVYGATKDVGMQPYRVTRVFNSECEEINLEDAFANYALYDIRERRIKIKGKVEYYLPRILSIIPYGRSASELKYGLSSPLRAKMKKEKKKNRKKYKKQSILDELKIARRILPMLSDFRAQDRNEWITVGWALYNVGDGCEEALDLWCEFSARCEQEYDESVCVCEWGKMAKKELTLGTLRYYASVDNPVQYEEFKREQASKYIHDSLSGSHNDIAKVLFAEFGDEFVCASVTSKIWYQFIGHRWERIEDGIFLRMKISGEIVQSYSLKGKDLLTQLAACSDKAEEAMVNARISQVQKMMGNLKSAPYKNNVMKECMEVFYDKRFVEKLDTNCALFPFNNGVYDLTENIFRVGRPEDFISKSAPIDYDPSLCEDDESVHDVHDYLEKVFPDVSVRRYFLDVSSDIFYGGNNQKHVYFWTGDGDNAKSVTQNIFERMLGKLAIKFNTTVITGKKVQSGSANPELARAGGGVRLATLEEPNNNEVINIGILKNLSGNDSYYARDLFEKGKEGREITPMFKLIFICNRLPKLEFSDKAVWNRIRVIPYESTFCGSEDPAPEDPAEQLRQKRFPKDPNFARKIPNMLQAFAWVLLNHRKEIKERVEPEKVRAATAVYRKANDIYRQFIEECVVEEKERLLSLVELYTHFKVWFRDSMPGHNLPVKNEVEEYFCRVWNEPVRGKKWRGYRIRTLQDDIDEGEAIVLDENDLVDYGERKSNLPPL